VTYTVDRVRGGLNLPSTNEAVFQISMKRRSGFYIWKIIVPLMMLAPVPSVVFWVDADMFDWLLKIPMTVSQTPEGKCGSCQRHFRRGRGYSETIQAQGD
jgi:hypothetical protein